VAIRGNKFDRNGLGYQDIGGVVNLQKDELALMLKHPLT
jgi:hypothetical protein